MLSKDLVNYYNDLDEVFGTAGWKKLVEEAKSEIYQLQADALDLKPVPGISTDFMLGKLQGRAEQLAYLVRLEEISDAQRRSLEAEDDADAEVGDF